MVLPLEAAIIRLYGIIPYRLVFIRVAGVSKKTTGINGSDLSFVVRMGIFFMIACVLCKPGCLVTRNICQKKFNGCHKIIPVHVFFWVVSYQCQT